MALRGESKYMKGVLGALEVLLAETFSLPADNSDESGEDYRIEAKQHYHARIEKLRRALHENADRYLIAQLALGVGFAAARPAVQRIVFRRREDVKRGKSKAGKTKAKPEQIAALLAKLKVTTGPSYLEKVRRACNASGWPYSIPTAYRIGRKNGLR